jgi:hypothetical protein
VAEELSADEVAGKIREDALAEDAAKAVEKGETSIMEVLLRIESKLDAFFEGVNSGAN